MLHKANFSKIRTTATAEANCGRLKLESDASNADYETRLSAMIVPVWVSSRSAPERRYLTYAMLDTQSDNTIITEEVARKLGGQRSKATLKVSTMTSTAKVIHCSRMTDLVIRGYNEQAEVSLPTTYSRTFIPHNKSHLPNPQFAKGYSHLTSVANKIPANLQCDVGLLIGYNCPRALLPLEVSCGKSQDEPYAVYTPLGWSIVGKILSSGKERTDEIGLSHRISCHEVPQELRIRHSAEANPPDRSIIAHRTTVRELNVNANEVMRLLEGDFCSPNAVDDALLVSSMEDKEFLKQLSCSITQDGDGHCSMPLPFKADKPRLPNNRMQALSRFKHLQKRLHRNPELNRLYCKFMDELFMTGEAEVVPDNELTSEEVWYLPHHGVLNPSMPGKIRVVFDGSCEYQGHSE